MEVQKRVNAPASKAPPRARVGIGVHISHLLALAIAALALGGTYLLWKENQQNTALQIRLESSLNQLITSLDGTLDQQNSVITDLAKHKHPEILDQLAVVATQQKQIQRQFKQRPEEWSIAEVDYLLSLAQHQYLIMNNLTVSRALLSSANQKLQTTADERFQPVIDQLNHDIELLERFTPANSSATTDTLNQLISIAESLPVAPAQFKPTPPSDSGEDKSISLPPKSLDEWKRYGGQLMNDLSGLFRISDGNKAEIPINQGQHYFLQQSLRLKLEAARIAYLTNNQQAYQNALSESQQWINRYFDNQDQAVSNATQALSTLNISIEEKPQLNIELIREQIQTLNRVESVPESSVIDTPKEQPTMPGTEEMTTEIESFRDNPETTTEAMPFVTPLESTESAELTPEEPPHEEPAEVAPAIQNNALEL